VLRTCLSLAAVTGKSVRITNIRGKRRKPGLQAQHLTCVNAAASVCQAIHLEGAEIGSCELVFDPGPIQGGDYRFEIGTAGSVILVAQTILPILARANEASRVTITGGTHAQWAPTFEFFERSFLPLFRRMGGCADAVLNKHGFYPMAGGSITLSIMPTEEDKSLHLPLGGALLSVQASALIANLSRRIADTELEVLRRELNIKPENSTFIRVEGPGPGNIVSIFADSEHVTEVFVGIGKPGLQSEAIAMAAIDQFRDYCETESAAVCEYLADQLLLPMALSGGGSFTTTTVSPHTTTNVSIIRQFVEVDISVEEAGRNCWCIKVTPR